MNLQTAYTVVGCMCVACVAISILLVAIMRLNDWHEERRARLYRKALEEASRRLGFRMIEDAYWLSEHPQVMLFMQVYGEAYRDNFQSSIENIRKTFQARIK